MDVEGIEEALEVADGYVDPVVAQGVYVRNFQEFFDAFGIKEGDPMYRPESERVHIW